MLGILRAEQTSTTGSKTSQSPPQPSVPISPRQMAFSTMNKAIVVCYSEFKQSVICSYNSKKIFGYSQYSFFNFPVTEILLPPGWKKTLPKADHARISKALFRTSTRTGKLELDMARYQLNNLSPLKC